MGDMTALWSYQEPTAMEEHQLGKKLLSAALELENVRAQAQNETKKNKEYVSQLIQLIKLAIQERDQATEQLGKLLLEARRSNNGPNSSAAESNSLSSDPYSNYAHNHSPVESFLETVTSSPPSDGPITAANKLDHGSLVVESLAKGRALPQRGGFVRAVVDAGPLLSTLLVAGPLPRWRNPPQVRAFDQIPSVSMGGFGGEFLGAAGHLSSSYMSRRDLACGSANGFGSFTGSGRFGNGVCSSGGFLNDDDDNGCYPLVKRQRLC